MTETLDRLRKTKQTVDVSSQKDLLTIPETVDVFYFSRRKFMRLIDSNTAPDIFAYYGKRRMVIKFALEQWLIDHPKEKEELKREKPRRPSSKA